MIEDFPQQYVELNAEFGLLKSKYDSQKHEMQRIAKTAEELLIKTVTLRARLEALERADHDMTKLEEQNILLRDIIRKAYLHLIDQRQHTELKILGGETHLNEEEAQQLGRDLAIYGVTKS
jgi:hypothetical protein